MRDNMTKLMRLIITTFLVTGSLYAQQASAKLSSCITCHQDVKNSTTNHYYVHRPVQEERCSLCHDTNSTDTLPIQPPENTTQIIIEPQEDKMEWLAESFIENTQQATLLPRDVAGENLTIKIWYKSGQKTSTEIQCPEAESLQRKFSEKTPEINQLHLHNYNELLLSRATLSWLTTTPCKCQLTYRYTNHEYSKDEDDFYALNHTLEIRNFDTETTSVMVTCTDSMQLSTSTNFISLNTIPLITENEHDSSFSSEQFSTQFKQIGDLIEITVTTNQPASLAIGRLESSSKPILIEETLETETIEQTNEGNHITLTNKEQLNTKICYRCHSSTLEGASHPINVLPPPGMIIPKEYPLLANGRLTCMTCHHPHSSNNEARLLKGGKKELCTGCHTNY